MKKKICFLIYDLRTGGAENMVSQISNELSDEFDITILLINYKNNYKNYLNSKIIVKNLNIIKISHSLKSLFNIFLKNKYDIVFSNIWPITIISSFLLFFNRKTKLVLIEHSILIDQFNMNKTIFIRILKYISVLIFYNLANKVIAVSNATKNSLLRLGVKEKKNCSHS